MVVDLGPTSSSSPSVSISAMPGSPLLSVLDSLASWAGSLAEYAQGLISVPSVFLTGPVTSLNTYISSEQTDSDTS